MNRNDWKKKLEYIELADLKPVCKFSSGTFGHVSLVEIEICPNISFALKTIPKATIKHPLDRQFVLDEKNILSQVQSNFIVTLFKTFKDNKYLYFLMEYLPGGELYNYLEEGISEDSVRFYMACVVEALDCLRGQNIVHNDISPENLLIDAEGYVKLIDFGMSKILEPEEVIRGFYDGSILFLPPEVAWPSLSKHNYVDNPYDIGRDKGVDLWALGILLYFCMNGTAPFDVDDEDKSDDDETVDKLILSNIIEGIESIEFPREISAEAEDLIRKLCAYDPANRLGYRNIEEIREHRWFDGFNWEKLRERKLIPPRVPEVKDPVDTQNFTAEVPDSDPELAEDESDWDNDF